MTDWALDTSVAVPLIMARHPAHLKTKNAIGDSRVALTSHSLAETFAVLTRLPADARLTPGLAAQILGSDFAVPIGIPQPILIELPSLLANSNIMGGAVYDALVGIAAAAARIPLLSRDQRALSTYRAVGAEVRLI